MGARQAMSDESKKVRGPAIGADDPAFSTRRLEPRLISETVKALSKRVGERFPGSGLEKLSRQLLEISRNAESRSRWISRPIIPLRVMSGMAVAFLSAALLLFVVSLAAKGFEGGKLPEIVQMTEAGINILILAGAAVFFLMSIESKLKRARAMKAIHELRVVAHLIDMHQLTKDPERILVKGTDTPSSPRRTMTCFELGRYLDYSSEMLSLTSNICALYIQDFDDAESVNAASDVENLANGISSKIWQKIMLLPKDGDDGRDGKKPVA